MHLTAICPTFRRARLIPNVVAMFLAQDFPLERCRLIIYDDGGTFQPQASGNWEIVVRPDRAPTLGAKFAELVELAISRRTDAIVLFEDDDIYLPGYLFRLFQKNKPPICSSWIVRSSGGTSQIRLFCPLWAWIWRSRPSEMGGFKFWNSLTQALGLGEAAWTVPDRVLWNAGRVGHFEEARNAHHGYWGFRVEAYLAAGGYPHQNKAFDVEFGNRLRVATGEPFRLFTTPAPIQYVYRWQTTGYPNGSGWGASMYESTALSHLYESSPGLVVPQLDEETHQAFMSFPGRKRKQR